MEINNKIMELRKENNLSQEQLAEKLGVARQTISKWELGETSPDIEQAKELAKIFNVTVDNLINNDVSEVIYKKVSHIEKTTKVIINILKIVGLLIAIVISILLFYTWSKDYFSVKPVDTMQSIECTINNHKYYYEVWMTNETQYIFDKFVTNDDEININIHKYTNFESAFKDIKTSVSSRGGTCH